MIAVAWSLSYEMFYYLAIPPVIGSGGLRYRTQMQRVAVFSVIAGGIAIYGIALGGHLRLIMFVFGILLYEIQNIGLVKAPSDSLAFLALTGS